MIDRSSSKKPRTGLITGLFACVLANGILGSAMKIRARAEPMVEAVEFFARAVETDVLCRSLHRQL